ncbi:MAG: AtpZ/AtpI family protein, partial [Bacteroidales bacterium]|nr:AtpZ/AtpI family protein [Bacteroidales bacterium]
MEDHPPEEQKKPNEPEKEKENSGLQNYARYSGMAFQMIVIIGLATWGGVKLDELLSMKTPVFTIVLSLLG